MRPRPVGHAPPHLQLQAGLAGQPPPRLGGQGRPHVLQRVAPGQAGVVVGGGVGADVVVSRGHIVIPGHRSKSY